MKTRSFVSYEFILIVKPVDSVTSCSSHTGRWPEGAGEMAQSSIKAFPGINVIYFSSKTIVLYVNFQR